MPSTPISRLPNLKDVSDDSLSPDEARTDEPVLEVDELTDADGEPPALEVDADDLSRSEARSEASSEDSDDTAGEQTEEEDSKRGAGFIALVLAALLVGSVAINLKQSRDVSVLETRSQEYEQALAAAVERIDSETTRAQSAEAALDRVDSAVDVVNERVLGLQQALDGLREATIR